MIDTAAAKAWLKVETTDEDATIGVLVSAAIGAVEKLTGKNLSVKPFTQVLAGFPCRYPYQVKLTRGPVVTVTGVEYDPADGGDPVTITDFRLVEGLNGALLPAYGATWPVTLDGAGTVRISGTAGFADGEVPELDQACLRHVAWSFANRGQAVPAGLMDDLIDPYRPVGLA